MLHGFVKGAILILIDDQPSVVRDDAEMASRFPSSRSLDINDLSFLQIVHYFYFYKHIMHSTHSYIMHSDLIKLNPIYITYPHTQKCCKRVIPNSINPELWGRVMHK